MSWANTLIVGILSAVTLTTVTSFIRSPWQTYPNGIARYAQDKGTPACDFPPRRGASCSDVRSVDYGLPWHTIKVNDGIFSNDANFSSDIRPGTFHNLAGIALNFLFYFVLTLFFMKMNKKGNPIWKVFFILLFIVDTIIGYFWLFESKGYGLELIKISFILLPIVNLLLLISYDMLITKGGSLGLLKVSFILLIIINLMFGYNVYEQERYGLGAGFLTIIPFISVLAFNDLIAVLFYIRTQHPQGHS
jgi:hypothetical protein